MRRALVLALAAAMLATPATAFGDGSHEAGSDMAPGMYHTSGVPGCEWAVLGPDGEVLRSGSPDGSVMLRVREGETLRARGCGEWASADAPLDSEASPLLAATAAQEEGARVCLVVDAGAGAVLSSALSITNGIKSGLIEIVRVEPCEEAGPEDPIGPVATGKWIVGGVETDPLTDAATAVSFLPADTGADPFGNAVTLVIRCSNGRTDFYIAWQDYLGSDDPTVTHRIGDGEPRRNRWNLSTSNDSTFFPNDAVALISSMLGETSFVAQTQPYNEGNVTAVFDLTGIEDAVAPIREACGW